jgi:hypothetical protein
VIQRRLGIRASYNHYVRADGVKNPSRANRANTMTAAAQLSVRTRTEMER